MYEVDIQNRIFKVLAKTLNIKEKIIQQKNWDSLKHISLITALEEEFNMVFEPEEIIEMTNYASIDRIIQHKLDPNISL